MAARPRVVLGSSSTHRRKLWLQHFPKDGCLFMAPDIDEKAIRHASAEAPCRARGALSSSERRGEGCIVNNRRAALQPPASENAPRSIPSLYPWKLPWYSFATCDTSYSSNASIA